MALFLRTHILIMDFIIPCRIFRGGYCFGFVCPSFLIFSYCNTLRLSVIRASYQFYSGRTYITSDTDGKKRKSNTLNTTVDPEEKRKIIGDTFMKVRGLMICKT